MKYDKSFLKTLFAAGMMFLLLTACAKPYHFYVKYDLPESPALMKDQRVTLQIRDARITQTFLSENAGKEFDLWDGTFAMYHSQEKPKGDMHTFDLTGLVEAAMQKRLESLGITVVKKTSDGVPLFELTLKTLQLDLKDRTWVSDVSYEVKLTRDNLKIGREVVSGQAERTKVMGRGAGEFLLGDILTDSINKLNIEKLFKNAGL